MIAASKYVFSIWDVELNSLRFALNGSREKLIWSRLWRKEIQITLLNHACEWKYEKRETLSIEVEMESVKVECMLHLVVRGVKGKTDEIKTKNTKASDYFLLRLAGIYGGAKKVEMPSKFYSKFLFLSARLNACIKGEGK